jgi:anti-anti-sigma factor
MLLRVRTLHTFEKTIVSTRGDIDLSTAQRLEAELQRELDGGAKHLVLNLAHTSYIDSSGLAVLIRAHKALQERDGALMVIGCRPTVNRIFNMVGLNSLFQFQERLPNRVRHAVTGRKLFAR